MDRRRESKRWLVERVAHAAHGRGVRFIAASALLLGPALALALAVTVRPAPAPLSWETKAASDHAPYVAGRCSDCHTGSGPDPGPLRVAGDDLCFSCHDQLVQHAHAFRSCLVCHNPHNSVLRKLLTADPDDCARCHGDRR
ncbi:MAG TPA: cytochrome c3 family protein [Anaeromyxobacteraceae bacterium]|nr:cytochrome c3 family protein [Anaeromyxobacteraceae bacterium]